MPKWRLKMRQIKEIMRLKYELNLSQQAIADSTGIARSTVKDYLIRAKAAGYTWPLPEALDNETLNAKLFPVNSPKNKRPDPDWESTHQELKRKGVTLYILWEEYKRENPGGYQYNWFAHRYRQWSKKNDVWMTQTYKAGEKIYVDYSGLTIPIWSTNLQQIEFNAEIFVSVLGASDYIFCVATKTQQLPDWIEAHCQMFEFYGGASELIVPDNLRSGVTKPHRYEPQCNLTYEEMAEHYGCAIMPTRAYKPRDKAKVEKSVQIVQQRIVASLRNKKFTALYELNTAILDQLNLLNSRKFQKLSCSRQELFNSLEKAALKPLPTQRYELAQWYHQTVNGGYHVQIKNNFYSVPYQYVRKKIDIRVTAKIIECFYKEKKIACHQRCDEKGKYTTVNAHRPEAHRQQGLWPAERLLSWAASIGCNTSSLIKTLLQDDKRHLHQKERSALGILRLSTAYGEVRLEQACAKALELGTYRYDSITSLLKKRLDHSTSMDEATDLTYKTPVHENVRGRQYYH